jgi:hypothetical protein
MDVARGFAVTGTGPELLRRFEAEPHTERVELGEPEGALRVLRWRLDPAVAEVAAPRLELVEGDASRTPAGSLLVDSRAGAARLRFGRDGRALELRIDGGHVALFALETPASTLPAFEPRVATGGEPPTGWLADHLAALEGTGAPLDRVAAAGALLRFWSPAAPADDPATGPPQVVRGVRAWARSLEAAAWAELEAAAVDRARRLADWLARFTDRRAEGTASAREALDAARERDALESVAVAMRLAGRGAALRDALATLDARARERLTALTDGLAPVEDERLERVAWSEPEAWWGALTQ